MGQRTMDKPPTKAKPSAEAEEVPDELDARLRQLAQDYFAAFYRNPTEEHLQLAQLLLAISSMPERRRELAQYERRLAGEAAPQTNPKHPDKFWRKVWVRLAAPLVGCEGDPDTLARELIVHLPASMRAKCAKYPTNPDELDEAVAAVVPKIRGLDPHDKQTPEKVSRVILRQLKHPRPDNLTR